MSTSVLDDVKPGDVFALVVHRYGRRSVSRVTIERLTKTQAIDTKARAWWRKNGKLVGGQTASARAGYWVSVPQLSRWTEEHSEMLDEERVVRRYGKAMEALGATGLDWAKCVPLASMRAALPHLEQAAAAISSAASPSR